MPNIIILVPSMMMTSQITIKTERQNNGDWLKIYIPYQTTKKLTASIQNCKGEIIMHLMLNEGNNAIDISNIEENFVNVKIDTPYEIILRNINKNPL